MKFEYISIFINEILVFWLVSRMSQKEEKLKSYLKCYNKNLWSADIMVSDKWIAFHQILKTLSTRNGKVFKASNVEEYIKKMQPYLPHLGRYEIDLLFRQVRDNDVVSFAAPPLINKDLYKKMETGKVIQNEFEIYTLYEDNKFYLRFTGSNTKDKLNKLQFKTQAELYAKKNWPNILKSDSDFMSYKKEKNQFMNPADTSNTHMYEKCSRVFPIYFAYDKSYFDVERYPWMRSPYKQRQYYLDHENLDKHVALVTHSEILFNEINPKLDYVQSNMCINDGSELGTISCTTCEIKFSVGHELKQYGLPIGDKVFNYLKKNENQIRTFHNIPYEVPVVPNESLLNMIRTKIRKQIIE